MRTPGSGPRLQNLSWSVARRVHELFQQTRGRKESRRSLHELGRSNLGLAAEVLEDRTLLATFIVNDDGGPGNFTAILAAIDNASTMNGDVIQITGGADRIHTEQGITVNKDLTIAGAIGANQV